MAYLVQYSVGQFGQLNPLSPGTTVVVVGNKLSTPITPRGSLGVSLDPDIPGSVYYIARITVSNQTPPNSYIRSPVGRAGYGGVFVAKANTTTYISVVIYSTPSEADRESYYNNGILLPSFTLLYSGNINFINSDPPGTPEEFYPVPANTGGPVKPDTGTPAGTTASTSGGNTDTGLPISVTSVTEGNVAPNIVLSVPPTVSSLVSILPGEIEKITLVSGDSNNIFATLGEVTDPKVNVKAVSAQNSITSVIPPLVNLNIQAKKTLSQLESIVSEGNTKTEEEKAIIEAQLTAIGNLLDDADTKIQDGINDISAQVDATLATLGEIVAVLNSGFSPSTKSVLAPIATDANVTPTMEEVNTVVFSEKIKTSDTPSSLLGKQALGDANETISLSNSTKSIVNNTIDTLKRSVQSVIDELNSP